MKTIEDSPGLSLRERGRERRGEGGRERERELIEDSPLFFPW